MKRMLVCGFVLIAMGLVAPLRAEQVWVPVVDAPGADGSQLATQLWISNFDGVERPYSSVFLKAESDGTELSGRGARATVPADRAVYLKRAAGEGETGLLQIDADGDLAINAVIQTARGRRTFYTGVPVITSQNQVAAGEAAFLNGVGRDGQRDVAQLALVNLGRAAAQCQVDFVGLDGGLLRVGGAVDVPALSLRSFADALGQRGAAAATAKVSCNQPFYAFAVAVDAETSEVSFLNPSAAIEKVQPRLVNKSAKELIVFNQTGSFHKATKEVPKKVIRVQVPKETAMDTIVAEFDVVAGPWNPRMKSGIHNLLWFHRGRFRSNTVANVNTNGANKYIFKSAQNIDLPRGITTKDTIGFQFEQGKLYHVRVVYNALNKTCVATLSFNGQVVKRLDYDATSKNHLILVPGTGLVAEFGNYGNQELPEVSSPGWEWRNFHVEMLPQ